MGIVSTNHQPAEVSARRQAGDFRLEGEVGFIPAADLAANDIMCAEALASRGRLREALMLVRRLPPDLRRRGKVGVLTQFIIAGQFVRANYEHLRKLHRALDLAIRLGLERDEAMQLRGNIRAAAYRSGLV